MWNISQGIITRPDEMDEVCYAPPLRGQRSKRLRAIGQTGAGRYLTIILELKRRGIYYLVTAREAMKK